MNECEQERNAEQCQHDQDFRVGKHRETMPQEVVISHEQHEPATQKQAKQYTEYDAPIKFASGCTHARPRPLSNFDLTLG